MYKKVITYTDFNGVEKTETLWFGLTESELTRMTMSEYGAMDDRLRAIVDRKDSALIMQQFDDLLRLSYGVKTADGRFVKKKDGRRLFDDFESTAAYDKVFMELCTNPAIATEFAKGILPSGMQAEAEAKIKEIEASEEEPSSQLTMMPNV